MSKWLQMTVYRKQSSQLVTLSLLKAHLCHVTYDNCHDDPINGNGFTKDYTAEQRPYNKVSNIHMKWINQKQNKRQKRRENKPDKVLGLNSRGFDTSSNDAGAGDINSPTELRTYKMLNTYIMHKF